MSTVARTKCPQCGEPGPHFVPPSMGEPGFYICEQTRIKADPPIAPASAAGEGTPPDELLIADWLRGAVALPPEEAPTEIEIGAIDEAIGEFRTQLADATKVKDRVFCEAMIRDLSSLLSKLTRRPPSERGTAPAAEGQP